VGEHSQVDRERGRHDVPLRYGTPPDRRTCGSEAERDNPAAPWSSGCPEVVGSSIRAVRKTPLLRRKARELFGKEPHKRQPG
jgi:hypothetical protein